MTDPYAMTADAPALAAMLSYSAVAICVLVFGLYFALRIMMRP